MIEQSSRILVRLRPCVSTRSIWRGLSRARHLHLGSFFLLDALRPDVPRLFDEARARGLTISIDTNYDPTRQWAGGLREALQRVDVFLPNETELLAITNADLDRNCARSGV